MGFSMTVRYMGNWLVGPYVLRRYILVCMGKDQLNTLIRDEFRGHSRTQRGGKCPALGLSIVCSRNTGFDYFIFSISTIAY